ncbi:hypothetical protein PXH69_30570 [Rhodococcus qingshengii]|uniref:Helix-turn-helix domain-containing protein n=1 Tax=Rhodococcus qingshengii TaxID=334542 RepID=A0AAW6LQH3_RHOSG|nr:hypothetical protein [Rhodococcus qingshengii]MDE8649324.1 hypothetical protein [Rhodococcus qingshengii]
MTTNIQPGKQPQATNSTSAPTATAVSDPASPAIPSATSTAISSATSTATSGATSPPTSTPTSLLQAMIKLEARGFTPIRHSFVQKHSTTVSGPDRKAVLADLVTARRGRELNAYLALLMNHSQIEKNAAQPWPAAVWARALSVSATDPLPVPAMSRIWARLEDHGLIDRSRVWKRTLVRPRDESTKRPYTRPRPDTVPEKEKAHESYFILPSAYWTEHWHTKLDLPARALLLIMLHGTSSKDETYLPYEKAESWYGISAKTTQRGIDQLLKKKLLKVTRTERVVADFSATGHATRTYYALTGPFSREARAKLQTSSASESAARAAAARAGAGSAE